MKSIRPCRKNRGFLGLCEESPTSNPILVFAGSVEMSILYSSLLLREGIPHNLLNANNAPRGQVIKESGRKGAVTVATSMAGRGTDIKLGPGVAELGGLVVVGTERMMSQRIDLQIRDVQIVKEIPV
ncbi:MAG: hypothetical protein ACLRZG_05105 [Streptococcus sp.]